MAGLADLAVRVSAEVDNFTQGMADVAKEGGDTASWLEDNWLKVGAATAAAGAGLEILSRKQAPLTEQTRKLAGALNMQEDEVRDLASGLTNVTFPLEDVLDLMETGRQQGIESAEQLEEYANFWDMVGDATGEGGPALAGASSALRAVGIAAGEESEALGAFGYVSQETTGNVKEFLNFLERTGPELREMGADVDDAAAIMGILEHEFGMTARMARQEFRRAVNEADGDLGTMLDTLGIGEDAFGDYQQAVDDSSDVIERNAEIHGESYTAMEKLQQKASELQYKYGDIIGVLGSLTPLLIALGPIMKGLSVVKGIWATVTSGSLLPALSGAITSVWSFTAALLANPMTWVVVGIMALIAAIVLLVKNWDTVVEALKAGWDWVKDVFAAGWEAFAEFWSGVWDGIKNVAVSVWDGIVGFFSGAKDKFVGIFGKVKDGIVGIWQGIWDGIKGFINKIIGGINGMIRGMNKLKWDIPDWVPLIGGKKFGINIPQIPTLHTGTDYFMPPNGGREGLALLERGERVIPSGQSGNSKVEHTGTIRVEGINNAGQLVAAADIVIEGLQAPRARIELDRALAKNSAGQLRPRGAW